MCDGLAQFLRPNYIYWPQLRVAALLRAQLAPAHVDQGWSVRVITGGGEHNTSPAEDP